MSEVCTTRQAAERLGVSLRTVQLWVESGVLKAWKTAGGHRRVARDSVDALVKQKREALGDARGETAVKILIVEPDPDITRLFELTLSSWNMEAEVITASNGVDGLMLLGRHRPDVIICDVVSPGLDGLEMIRILRNNPEHDALSIIVVSSLDADEISARGGLPDGVSYFAKPIQFDAIEALVEKKVVNH